MIVPGLSSSLTPTPPLRYNEGEAADGEANEPGGVGADLDADARFVQEVDRFQRDHPGKRPLAGSAGKTWAEYPNTA